MPEAKHAHSPGRAAPPPAPWPATGVRMLVLSGIAVIAAMLGGVGLWASTTEIAGAVIAPGTVVVDSHVKKVQHPSGGIVGEIRVRDGDRVAAGDLLLRLDPTAARANLQIIQTQFAEAAARSARLSAERDGAPSIAWDGDDPSSPSVPDIAAIRAGEQAIFDSRRTALAGQREQLRERIAQFGKEIEGLEGQRTAKAREIALIADELTELTKLEEKKLVTSSKMVALRREAARLAGEDAHLTAAIAQTRGRIAEAEIVILQREQESKAEAVRELREVGARLAELEERRVTARDILQRIDVRAPHAGVVHELAVHTVGGVITAGEPILLIVPEGERLTVEARVAPKDREQIATGAMTRLRFAAFDHRTTPEIDGRVTHVAADLSEDRRTGLAYYVVRISIDEGQEARLAGQRLVPGLPAEVQIRTERRTALTYLLKPFEDQLARAFRER